MLEPALTQQLAGHLQLVQRPVELVASLDDSPKSAELLELLEEVAALSEHLSVVRRDDDERRPSFAITRVGTDVSVRFAGLPLGHELSSFVLALVQVGGHPPNVPDDVAERVAGLEGEFRFETFLSLSCQNCPDVVQALNAMSVLNPRISHVAIDGALFREEVEERGVLAVPSVFLDGEPFEQGRMTLEQILGRLDASNTEQAAEAIEGKETFDVLVVGAGPGGTSSAIYAARKGIRTGVVAERIGGQVLDTMGIENFISVPYTEGPKFAAELEQHLSDYEVDVMDSQRATRLVPAEEPGGPHTVELESGASVRGRTVVLASGARWRHLGVPGEQEYRNKGVTYCPHCDGPLFKGKRVAVVGGGNSGVEAAIDLAGVVAHVTLLEFQDALLADDVLQRKLRSLPNVDVVLEAATTEVLGDGGKVTGLRYDDRPSGESRTLDLEGVFVQIGLLPNTEWLEGAVELTDRGEVVVDERGATSVPGVFAAGDCTTVPYKQIVTAMGTGSVAALSAFDHLIRTTAPA
ncbi:MAG: alkyl hydroperoxide reductase subunit F [Nocardioidaceae bacterium]